MKNLIRITLAVVLLICGGMNADQTSDDLKEFKNKVKAIGDKVFNYYMTENPKIMEQKIAGMKGKFAGPSESGTKAAVSELTNLLGKVAFELSEVSKALTTQLLPVIEKQETTLQEQAKLLDIQTKSLRNLNGRLKVLEETKK